jgi:hypothetical protein
MLKIFSALVTVLFVCITIPTNAQDSSSLLPDNPDPASPEKSLVRDSFELQQKEKLQEKPLDTNFFLMASSDIGLSLADSAVSSAYVSHSIGCHESDSLYGSLHPSPARYFVQASLTSVGAIGLSYLLKRKGFKFWAVPTAIDGVSHFAGVVNTVSSCKNVT